jgi:Rrf2 family protein
MHLTRESEYALLALGHFADAPPGVPVPVAELAEARGLPAQFLSKICQKLRRAGILTGGRGRGSGYELARPPAEICVGHVLAAVEAPDNLNTCLLWQGYCGDANPCPLHHELKAVHQQIRDVVKRVTLAEYLGSAGHKALRHETVRRTRLRRAR